MTDISQAVQSLWEMFTDLFYLVLTKFDSIFIFNDAEFDIHVTLLDFCVTATVISIILGTILGIRYRASAKGD